MIKKRKKYNYGGDASMSQSIVSSVGGIWGQAIGAVSKVGTNALVGDDKSKTSNAIGVGIFDPARSTQSLIDDRMNTEDKVDSMVSPFYYGMRKKEISFMPSKDMLKASYAMGGNTQLSEFNNGGTHEENPLGGIPLGKTASVEQGETKWEDYIFSDRLPVPGSKKTFADVSKEIQKRNFRKNDPYTEKALNKEMNKLIKLQESFKQEQGLNDNSLTMALGGSVTDPEKVEGEGDKKEKKEKKTDFVITPGSKPNENILVPRASELVNQYEYLTKYKPVYDKSGKKMIYGKTPKEINEHPIVIRKKELQEKELDFRRKIAEIYNLPVDSNKLPDYTKIKSDLILDKSKLPEEFKKEFYNTLYEQQAIRDAEGFKRKQYYGDIEAEQNKYDENTPLEDLNLGTRFITGVQSSQLKSSQEIQPEPTLEPTKTPVQQTIPQTIPIVQDSVETVIPQPVPVEGQNMGYGGRVKYSKGGYGSDGFNLSQFMAMDKTLNPNIGALEQGANSKGVVGKTPVVFPSNEENYSNERTSDEPTNLVTGSTDTGARKPFMEKGDAVAMGIQMLPSIYNLAKSSKKDSKILYDRLDPRLLNFDSSRQVTNEIYDQQGNIVDRQIRDTATGSGQALSAKIASANRLAKDRQGALSQINERENNMNQQIRGNNDRTNLQTSIQEEIVNAQTRGANETATGMGLSQLANAAGTINRDRNASNVQEGAIQTLSDGRQYKMIWNPETKRREMIFIKQD